MCLITCLFLYISRDGLFGIEENYVVIIVSSEVSGATASKRERAAVLMKEHTLLSDRLKSIFHRPVLSLASRFVFFHVEVSGGPGYSYFHTFLAFLAAPSSRSLLLFLFEYAPHIITSRKKTFTRIDIKIHCGFCVLRCAAARLGRGKVRCEDLFLNIARPEKLKSSPLLFDQFPLRETCSNVDSSTHRRRDVKDSFCHFNSSCHQEVQSTT